MNNTSSQTIQTTFVPTFKNYTLDNEQMQGVLQSSHTEMANAVNNRTISTYDLVEIQNGNQFFSDQPQKKRQAFRKVFQVSDANLTFNHNITGAVIFYKISGGGTNGTIFFPLPYVSTTLANQIQLDVTSTQVIVTKGGGAPAITSGIIVLEYLKN
jgi:hypothetical protein